MLLCAFYLYCLFYFFHSFFLPSFRLVFTIPFNPFYLRDKIRELILENTYICNVPISNINLYFHPLPEQGKNHRTI